jgi:hypothetical protein
MYRTLITDQVTQKISSYPTTYIGNPKSDRSDLTTHGSSGRSRANGIEILAVWAPVALA